MARPTFFLGLAVLVTAFSGCVFDLDGDAEAERIVKKVKVDLTDEDPEDFEDVVETALEYTHRGADVGADDVTVEYVSLDGRPVERSLSRFTSQATIRDGDVVKIEPVNFTSGLVVRTGSEVLAERGAHDIDWFTAGGSPVPLRSTLTGAARYDLEAGSSLRFRGEKFTLDEDTIHSIEASYDANLTGKLSITTSLPAKGPRLEADARLKGEAGLYVDADATVDGTRERTGADARLWAWLNATGSLQFDSRHRLDATGSSSSIYADGDVVAWNQTHPKSEGWRPEDIDHPILDETTAYEEEPFEADDDVSKSLVEFLMRVYNMRIGVGDEYRFEAREGEPGEDHYVKATVVVQVTGRERREAAGQRHDTLRVSQTITIVTKTPGSSTTDYDLAAATLWVSADRHIPVYEQGSYKRTFDREDLRRILDAYGGDDVSVPESGQLVVGNDYTLRLMEYAGDFTVPPIVGLLGFTGGEAGLAFASVMVLVSDLGEETYEAAPTLTFSLDEAADRIVVTSAASNADWTRLEVQSDVEGVRFALNGNAGPSSPRLDPAWSWHPVDSGTGRGVLAGDFIDLCRDGGGSGPTAPSVSLRDFVANQYVYSAYLQDVAAC